MSPPVARSRQLVDYLRDYLSPAFAFLIAMIALVLIWRPIGALGTPVGGLAFAALALLWAVLMRPQAISEFPDAQTGDVFTALRGWAQRLREGRGPQPRP
jgi:hypothetical protein